MLEQQPEDIVERASSFGLQRLARSWLDILITGVIGGIEVSLGGLAAMTVLGPALEAAPNLRLYGALALAGLVFPVGFLFVIMGRSELFTENFLIPVVALRLHGRSPKPLAWLRSVLALCRLWFVSWTGNILGCALIAALLSVPQGVGEPLLHGYAVYTAYKLSIGGSGLFVSAVLAGLTMTVLTWLVVAMRHPLGKALAIFAAGYVLFSTNMSHAIAGAAVLFAGCSASGHSCVAVLRWLGIVTAGNLVGGVGLVTLFRLAQVWEQERQGTARRRHAVGGF